jgi:hypothetical protein
VVLLVRQELQVLLELVLLLVVPPQQLGQINVV